MCETWEAFGTAVRQFFREPDGEKAHECATKMRAIVEAMSPEEQGTGKLAVINELRRMKGLPYIGPEWLQEAHQEAESLAQ